MKFLDCSGRLENYATRLLPVCSALDPLLEEGRKAVALTPLGLIDQPGKRGDIPLVHAYPVLSRMKRILRNPELSLSQRSQDLRDEKSASTNQVSGRGVRFTAAKANTTTAHADINARSRIIISINANTTNGGRSAASPAWTLRIM